MASITDLWSTAVSVATFADQTNASGIASSSSPSRLNTNTSVHSMLSKAHDFTIDDTYLDDYPSEERMPPPLGAWDAINKLRESTSDVLPPVVARVATRFAKHANQDPAAEKLTTKLLIDMDKPLGEDLLHKQAIEKRTMRLREETPEHVAAEQELGNAQKRKKRIAIPTRMLGRTFDHRMCVKWLHDKILTERDPGFDEGVVTSLTELILSDGQEEPRVHLKDVVITFRLLRDVPYMTEHADNMQRLLAVAFSEDVEEMFTVWKKALVSPDFVYKMLPIAEETILTNGVGNGGRWSEISKKLKPWLEYIIMKEDFLSERPILQNQQFGHISRIYLKDAILQPLTVHSTPEDLTAFLRYLQADKDLLFFSRAIQQILLDECGPLYETKIFEWWAKANVNPQELFELVFLPESDGNQVLYRVPQWIRYVVKYRHHHHDYFPDYESIIRLLLIDFDKYEVYRIIYEASQDLRMKDQDSIDHSKNLLNALNSLDERRK